jgi:polyphosphate:AMP phosphotransferase
MFEPAEVGAKLSEKAFAKIKDQLRLDLIDLQQHLREADFPVLLVIAGVPGAGVVDTLNLLNTWMDPRWIATTVFDTPSDEERERPLFWRYWRSLPKAGTIGLYLSGWYEDPMREVATRHLSAAEYALQLERIARFERTLSDEGALILKFWLHISKTVQHRHHTERREDALVGLRPTDTSLALPGSYDALVKAGAKAIQATMEPGAPWHIIEGTDDTYRRATVLGLLRDALTHHLEMRRLARKETKALMKQSGGKKKHTRSPLVSPRAKEKNVLDAVKMPEIAHDAYEKRFHALQAQIYDAHKLAREAELSSVLVFEGWDAAGKGGAVRRLSYALNARNYKIIPIAAPTDEERAHHYLWRFWRELQRAGHMTIFDRSWYGRVLVERVENLIPQDDWTRAYSEINAFEDELANDHTLVMKFWLHITNDEQLKRFKARKKTPYKSWKLTDDDWRNRDKWNAYKAAVHDMVAYTSTERARWHLIGANDKKHARIAVLEIVAETLRKGLRARGIKIPKG